MIKNTLISIVIGAAFFISWHFLMNMTWGIQGNFDIIDGIIIEFFLFTLLIHLYYKKQDEQIQKHLSNHLNKIESLLNKAHAKIEKLEKRDGE